MPSPPRKSAHRLRAAQKSSDGEYAINNRVQDA